MNIKQFTKLLIGLLGFYTIYSVIVKYGILPLALLIQLLMAFSLPTLLAYVTVIAGFLLLAGVGILLIGKADLLCHKLLTKLSLNPDTEMQGIDFEKFAYLAFSLLGLLMLLFTVPSFLRFLLDGFYSAQASQAPLYGVEPPSFLDTHFAGIVYHATSVAFSAFVFLKGKFLTNFVFKTNSVINS